MERNLEQVAQYVGQQLQQGMSEQSIREALAQNRWTPEWIDAAFNVVHQNPAKFGLSIPAPAMSPQEADRQTHPPGPTQFATDLSLYQEPQQPVANKLRSLLRNKRLLVIVAAALVVLGLAIGAYFMWQSKDSPKPATITHETKQAKAPDEQRKDDLNIILSDLADYYVSNHAYPTTTNMGDPAFIRSGAAFNADAFTDPAWSIADSVCTVNSQSILTARPTPHCYAYEATTSDGKACDNKAAVCTKMTLTATLDDSKPYAITLDRNTQAGAN